MPRLFTALAVPDDCAQRLAAFRGGLPDARWVDPEDYHVTLRFLGDVDGIEAQEAHAGFAALPPRAPFEVVLHDLTQFGGDKPRAIIAAVAPSRALSELQADHERIARAAGLAPETRRFTPHVTLARLARRTPPGAVAHYLAAAGVFARLAYTVDRATLYSARESRGGGPYRPEADYPFAGSE